MLNNITKCVNCKYFDKLHKSHIKTMMLRNFEQMVTIYHDIDKWPTIIFDSFPLVFQHDCQFSLLLSRGNYFISRKKCQEMRTTKNLDYF